MSSSRFAAVLFFSACVLSLLSHPLPASAAPGDIKWKYETGHQNKYTPAMSIDTIYMPSTAQGMDTFTLDGHRTYKFTNDLFGSFTIHPNGDVITGARSMVGNMLIAFKSDLDYSWSENTVNFSGDAPAAGPDGTIYLGATDNKLYAFTSTGSVKWTFPTTGQILSSPAVADDNTVYFGCIDTYLYAVNPDGSQKWKFKTGQPIYSSPAIGPDGAVYIGSRDNYLYAVTPNGALKWKYKTDGGIDSSPAVGTDQTIIVGSDDQYVHAVNPDGSPKWKFKTWGAIRSSPALGADGTVYIYSSDQKLYTLDRDSNLKWKTNLNPTGTIFGDAVKSSPIAGLDGTVYIRTSFGTFFAIEGEPTGSEWPMFRVGKRSLAAVGNGDFLADPTQASGVTTILQKSKSVIQTGAAVRAAYPEMAGYAPAEAEWHYHARTFPTASNATFSFCTASLSGTAAEFGLYLLRSNGSVPFSTYQVKSARRQDGEWWIAEGNSTEVLPKEAQLKEGTTYRVHFTVMDNGSYDTNATDNNLNGRVTLGRFPAGPSPDTSNDVQVTMKNATAEPRDTADLVTTYGAGGAGITPVSDMIKFNAEVSPAGSLAVFRFNSTKLEGALNTMIPRKFFDADLSYRDYGKYFFSPNSPSEGHWWITYRNNTRLEADAALVKGTNYYINLVIRDNGLYDADPTPGKIADPVVLAQSPTAAGAFTGNDTAGTVSASSSRGTGTSASTGTFSSGSSSGGGCMMNPTAGFGLEWLMLLIAPFLGLVRFRRGRGPRSN